MTSLPQPLKRRQIMKDPMLKHGTVVGDPKPMRGPKMRKCGNKACRKPYHSFQSMVCWCSPECGSVIALERVAKQKAKAARAERAETKAKLMPYKKLSYFHGITKRHCHEIVRLRDPDECISCGVRSCSAWQAGHFISVGANSTLRYNLDNINKQCIQCNMELGGNPIPYEAALRLKIGDARVDALKGWHPPINWTREYLQELAIKFRAEVAQLKKERT